MQPLEKNLLKAGHTVVCYDNNPPIIEEVVAAGSTEVAPQADFVITMLPNSPHIKSAVMGVGGVLEGAKEGLMLVDMSSLAPFVS